MDRVITTGFDCRPASCLTHMRPGGLVSYSNAKKKKHLRPGDCVPEIQKQKHLRPGGLGSYKKTKKEKRLRPGYCVPEIQKQKHLRPGAWFHTAKQKRISACGRDIMSQKYSQIQKAPAATPPYLPPSSHPLSVFPPASCVTRLYVCCVSLFCS